MSLHISVLLDEAVDALIWRPDGVYIDATFGRGGHSRAVLRQLASNGHLIAFDRDPQALTAAADIVDPRFEIVQRNFAALSAEMAQRGIQRISGILLDLGVSSPQLNDPKRGFSFRLDGPLDMRMDPSHGISAAQWLARASQQALVKVIKDYGEERFAVQIAKAIIARRVKSDRSGLEPGPIVRTSELADLVSRIVKTRERGQHPATRTFQAIRIHINQELVELKIVLEKALALLEQGGRLVVISFHSLEDRIVKRFMKTHANPACASALDRDMPIRAADLPNPSLRLLGRVRASKAELCVNPHARSAVMRVAEKV